LFGGLRRIANKSKYLLISSILERIIFRDRANKKIKKWRILQLLNASKPF